MIDYVIEFIGTFFLVLTVALTGSPLAIGAVYVAMMYIGGATEGAHFNPAVTGALWLRGQMKWGQALRYMGLQLAAGFVAAAVYYLLRNTWFALKPGDGVGFGIALLTEVIFTFILTFTILRVGVKHRAKDNPFYGVAAGFVLMSALYAGSQISGGAYNPAVGLGPLLFDISSWSANGKIMALYLAGPMIGGALAALVEGQIEASS